MVIKHKRTIRTLSHCFYDLKYHIVWTPKYRGKVLKSEKIKSELRRTFEIKNLYQNIIKIIT